MASFQQKLALKGSESSIEHFATVLKEVKEHGGWNTASALVRPDTSLDPWTQGCTVTNGH